MERTVKDKLIKLGITVFAFIIVVFVVIGAITLIVSLLPFIISLMIIVGVLILVLKIIEFVTNKLAKGDNYEITFKIRRHDL